MLNDRKCLSSVSVSSKITLALLGNYIRPIFLLFPMFLTITSCGLKPTDVQDASTEFNKAIVFDIDGTLTPNIISIYTARENAARAVHFYADNGYKIIYLSARVKVFQFNIPYFIKHNGFPKGSIHVPQSSADRDDFAAFKQRILERYQDKGWTLDAAYGDSSSDFEASGIRADSIYAIKRVGDKSCQPGSWIKCLESWTEQLASLTDVVP